MARNRGEPIKEPPPEPESSDDEEGSSEESGSEESDSGTEQTQTQTQTPAKPPQPMEPSSSSGEESDSEVESDAPASKVKPLASKPVPVEEKQKASDGASKARSKAIAPDPVTMKKSPAAKRPAEDTSAKDAKKSKKADEPETSEKKSNRLWSEEDEIVVLEGMIDYTSKKKADPVLDLSAFHDFIKQKLSIDVTRTQLQDKIRRLKKKYVNNKSKEKDGEQKTFSKPHEHKSYDLSKLIWGKRNETIKENGGPKATSRVARKTDSIKAEESEEAEDTQSERSLTSNSVGANVEERMLIAGQMLEGKEEWEKLKEEELELYLKQLDVKVAQTKLVLDAMKGRGH